MVSALSEFFLNRTPSQKSLIVILFDLLIAIATFYLSFAFRYEDLFFPFIEATVTPQYYIFLIAPAVQSICFYIMGLYKGVWRFSSTPDLVRVIKGVSLAVPVSFVAVFFVNRLEGVPRSVYLIQWFLLIVSVGGIRFAYRIHRDNFAKVNIMSKGEIKKTLIVGAGYAAAQLIRDIKNDPLSPYYIEGFIDDDDGKKGKILHGIKVLGKVNDINKIVSSFGITHIIIAIPSASKEQLSTIVNICKDLKLEVRTIPKIGDLLSGKVQITRLRKVTATDLLGREQINLNIQVMDHMLAGKKVLVTGAGGSIGSELCFQIANFKPKKIICFDSNEFNLYELEFKLSQYLSDVEIVLVLGNVTDEEKVSSVFTEFTPQIVFHAAAYKHVPLVEDNISEAIKVNVGGTKTVAELANKYGIEKFVLVSTDKAVNPTNVMGTTKRVAEIVCQVMQNVSNTKYEIVRFGNVLGSSGSVIPRFQKQIENGGPVTVTHPEIERFFMSIPEASQLVIQAGAMGSGGEIFVLDMGEPIKIINLAKQMINLAGFKVDEDIKIEFSGLRPGEKLYEELLTDDEKSIPTTHDRVRVAKVRPLRENLFPEIESLIESAKQNNVIRIHLKNIVPEYEIPKNLLS